MFPTLIDVTSITLVVVPPQPVPMPSLRYWAGPETGIQCLAAPPVVKLLPAPCPLPVRAPAQEKKRFMADFQARLAELPSPTINVNGRDGQLYVYSGGRIAFTVIVRLAAPPSTTIHARRPGETWSASFRCRLSPEELLTLRERFSTPVAAATVDQRARFEADLRAELHKVAGHRLTMIGRGAQVTVTDLTAGRGLLRLHRTWDNGLRMEAFVPTSQRDRGQPPAWGRGYPGAGQDPDYLWPLVDRLVEAHNAALEPAAV